MVQRAPVIREEQSFIRETPTIIDIIERHCLELVTAREGRKDKAETIKRERLCLIQSRKPLAVCDIHKSA